MLSIVALTLSTVSVSADASTDTGAPRCSDTMTSTQLTEGGKKYQVYGELCLPAGKSPDTVQLLLPGGTYNHTYWDFPYQPERYSYVRHMTKAGHATFNIDRIGTGRSEHPLSVGLSVYEGAYSVHQLVGKLRDGKIAGTSFDKVVLVGHSLGSSVLWAEAAKYQDVDGVIITGMMHPKTVISVDSVPKYSSLTYPAMLQSQFKDRDPGYITTIPGTRGSSLFYNKGNFDPEVTQVDEETKDTITAAELATFPVFIIDGTSSKIRVPTLVVTGGKDAIFCGIGGVDCSSAESVLKNERAHYSPQAKLSTYVLPNAGHDINLHRNAPDWFNAADKWVTKFFGR